MIQILLSIILSVPIIVWLIVPWVKQFSPDTKVIGVEPEDAATLFSAMQAGERVELTQVGIFADGVAVKKIGANTFELAKQYVDEVILVSIDELCAGIKDIFDDTRVVSEPAGALAVVGVKKYVQREQCKNLNLVAINSGANINFDRLRHVVHPLAGLGLNLGLADVQHLVDLLKVSNRPLGSERVLRQYERARKSENILMQKSLELIDVFFRQERSFAKQVRSVGVNMTNKLLPLKLMFMRHVRTPSI